MSSSFRITHPLITLKIRLEEVDRLHIHEETIPDILSKLAEKIETDGYFIHPIIVDEKSLVVLDGMHRVAAVQKLGYSFIPVCLVDYDNPHIVVSSWYRLIDGLSDVSEASSVLQELNLTTKECSFETAHRLVEKREAITTIFSRRKCFAVYGSQRGIKEMYDTIKQIGFKLQSKGYKIGYDTGKDAKEKVYSGKVSAALITPIVSKEEIVKTALAGKVFAQKTTRHIIPARPMFINVPNEWLHGELSLSEANDHLVKLLSSKKLKRLPSGQVLDRIYEEELFIFE
jgi:hypothetical protein